MCKALCTFMQSISHVSDLALLFFPLTTLKKINACTNTHTSTYTYIYECVWVRRAAGIFKHDLYYHRHPRCHTSTSNMPKEGWGKHHHQLQKAVLTQHITLQYCAKMPRLSRLYKHSLVCSSTFINASFHVV